MIYYVATNGNDNSNGTKEAPFKTINHAAQIAVAGDTVRVYGGVYREWVDPCNSGKEYARITYEAVEGEKPVIKGSEVVTDWERVEGTVWKKVLSNSMFGDFNPFAEKLCGDWFVKPDEYDVHLGDVYINGVSMYEARSFEELKKAERREAGFCFPTKLVTDDKILYPENTVYQWYAEIGDDETVLFCNFQEYDPNNELIEINVRPCCFFPKHTGINYITLRGFEIAQGAPQWAPPTAEQLGLVGPHWSKGWIIENNHIHNAKCVAISLGKEITTGHNFHTRFARKSGYMNQAESVFNALRIGWSKEKIGSHIVRNNVIHDCGQAGIAGHLGCAFSRIEHNHIYNITKKQEFFGYEVGCIKLHAAIDVVIENNNFHDCSIGLWLDWQAQGTRVTKNLFYNNAKDLLLEVTHGPCLVDNNILMSKYLLQNAAQGTAYVHNLMCGFVNTYKVLDRATPYHYPHTTQVAGYAFVHNGDDRVFNNIILGKNELLFEKIGYFGSYMDGFSDGMGEYMEKIWEIGVRKDHRKYHDVPQPVWCEGNAYAGFAKPFRAEKRFVQADSMSASIEEKNGKWILTLNIPESVANTSFEPVTTDRLGTPRITEERFEDPDGAPIDFTLDVIGNKRDENIAAGPFAKLSAGENRVVVWSE